MVTGLISVAVNKIVLNFIVFFVFIISLCWIFGNCCDYFVYIWDFVYVCVSGHCFILFDMSRGCWNKKEKMKWYEWMCYELFWLYLSMGFCIFVWLDLKNHNDSQNVLNNLLILKLLCLCFLSLFYISGFCQYITIFYIYKKLTLYKPIYRTQLSCYFKNI